MSTLKDRARNAQLRLQIAENKAKERYLQYVNDNLNITRRRKTGWTAPGAAERDFTSGDRRKAMAQARQLIDESPLALGLLRSHLAYVIGDELRLNMQSGDPKWDEDVEAWWAIKRNQLDIRGTRSWGRLNWCWQGRKIIDGDVGIAMIEDGDKAWVQTIEADRIYKTDPEKADDYGIDVDDYGQPLTYYVGKRDPKKTDKSVRYDRRFFELMSYQPNERAETLRGMSGFLCLLNLLKDLEETEEAMSAKVKKEAFYGLKFKSVTPDLGPFGNTGMTTKSTNTQGTRPHVSMVPGMNLTLEPSEEAEILESKSPNSDYQWFIRWRIRKAGMPLGLPLEYILMDSSEVNYSGLMTLAQMLRRIIRVYQSELKGTCSRLFAWALGHEGRRVLGDPPDTLKLWWNHSWGAPSGGFIDPQKEADAFKTRLESGVASRQDFLQEYGDGTDYEDLVRQLKKEENIRAKSDLKEGEKPEGGEDKTPKDGEEESENENED